MITRMKKKFGSTRIAAFSAAVLVGISFAAGAADIGFEAPYADWRTPIQLAAKHVKDTFYEPVSVFTTNDDVEVSFGWKSKAGSVTMPPVKFSVVDEQGAEVVAWTEPARPLESSVVPSDANAAWSGHWPCDILKLFTPGDYMLTAELDPANTLGESGAARADNTAIFRFAIRDESLALPGMMIGFNPLDITAIKGNDFAQEPHAALRDFVNGSTCVPNAPMVQFGPYVPMDGKSVSSRKKPLDLVFLIDISGSMGGCIQGLLNNVGVFVEKLMKGDANNDPIDDLRVKIVGFRDYKSSWDRIDLGWYHEGAFSGNLSTIKSKLSSFRAQGGGGNGGETSFDALWYVAKDKAPNTLYSPTDCVNSPSPFRPKDEAARAVILFTDEPPHDPLSANGCSGLTVTDVVKAVEDADINLTVITTSLSGYSGNYGVDRFNKLANTNAYPTAAKKSTYIRTSNLATFANDASALRDLAGQVLSQVDTVVVEPSLVTKASDHGILSFKWKNDSTAGTNNVFSFLCYNGASRSAPLTNIVCTATDDWRRVSIELGDGDHTFEWSYRKIGYTGAIVDAGLIADLSWEPWATQLKLNPTEFTFECDVDLSGKVEVTCNEIWRTLTPNASWVHVSASGNGNGSFTFTVDPNPNHDYRSATITVRAGEHGNAATDVIVERTVTILQKPSPYNERGMVEIFDVDVKPRWPWSGLVDIDFRLVAPAKNTPVSISLVGWDREGEGFGFSTTTYDVACQRYARHDQIVNSANGGCRNVVPTSSGTANATFSCPSSGIYRITWNLSDWGSHTRSPLSSSTIDTSVKSALYPNANNFHSSRFSVILSGTAGAISGVSTSDTVRVDTRQVNLCGGLLAAGVEKIGHPTGAIDPIPWDSTVVTDGVFDPRVVIPVVYRPMEVEVKMTNKVCVLNDVYVEGGQITNDVVWKADRVHVVRDNVFIMEGASLTIEDGAVVKMCNATKIFSHTVPNNLWNLVVKGAYITDACDRDTGGDTLYSSTAVGHALSFQKLCFDQTFPSTMSDLYTNGRGILPLGLYRYRVQTDALGEVVTNKYGNAKHTAYLWRTRFYTRNQPYGALPYPVEPGDSFYGWFRYSSDPWTLMETNSKTYEGLVADAMISDSAIPNIKGNYADRIYAISDVPDPNKYPVNHWPMADGGDAKITLSRDSFIYDGATHKPTVTEVKVGEAIVPSANYNVTWTDASGSQSSAFKDVGVYFAKVTFLHDYTNSPSASYVIQPAAAAAATISFSPASYTYTGSAFAPPTVSVKMGNRTLSSSEYSIGWSSGDWTSPGTYRATVELKGNYTGTVSRDFYIQDDPNLMVVFYGNDTDVSDRLAVMARQGLKPRILYLSGSDVPGTPGVSTRGIMKLLKEDVAIRSFVLTNFVCRYADWQREGSQKCASVYAPTFKGDPLPFLGVLSSKLANTCLAWTNGYMSASGLLTFLEAAAAKPDVKIPAVCKVTLGKNGGTGGDNYVTCTEGQPMPTPRTAPTLAGWTFAGYWDTIATEENGNPKGKQYYDANMKSVRNFDKTTAVTLWAKWTNKVTFGKNGGTGGDDYVTCTKGQPMPKRTMPTRSGYVFDGYWNTTGTGGIKYYNADGTSAHAWDRSGNVTLWAKWEKAASVKVTFGKNGGSGGDNYVTATTGQAMPTPRTAPKRTGWTFEGYWDTIAQDANGNPTGKQYYDKDMKSVRNWDKTSAVTLWAKWTVKVTLGKNGGVGGDDSVTVTYNQPFPTRTMPTMQGCTFGGYWVSSSRKTGQCYNPDGTGTASMKWTTGGTPTVWALWTVGKSAQGKSRSGAGNVGTAVEMAPPEEVYWPAGLYTGVFSGGEERYTLQLDDIDSGNLRTAYFIVESEAGSVSAECDAVEFGSMILLTAEDGDMYFIDLAEGVAY